ncbi:hypothetical protein KIN20_031604 [Parelaphostrongylus tenuis]|uniref:Uncharacterized protein n=1 Tax=Parelaphostrongylus tenuis TaxID=148309 RepID=A0AAD5WHC2_PARTN|nr:hypothetical protein KIN20_031604 [Parelaphostrongylus tenuis]
MIEDTSMTSYNIPMVYQIFYVIPSISIFGNECILYVTVCSNSLTDISKTMVLGWFDTILIILVANILMLK